ncbi:ROK family protein [Runella aurantiaca]|uniref:ROK family protein n=1 Tax=Runella aurantiaca TaxID=2282308 RepID=A0A369I8M3_9BACT|nr:ROK family protein [Runella aurantiaca]RDB03873.1 ROK family protein [Runella aurantiaca]
MQKYIGADIGGTHITAALVDIHLEKVAEHSLRRSQVNPHAQAEEILAIWADTIHGVVDSAELQHSLIGIAIPGPFDYKNGICWMKNVNKYEHLYGLDIKNELAIRLGLAPQQISFRNDAEAFLEGEMLFGAGKTFEKSLGITLGTGLGTSFFEHGNAVDLALGINHPLHEGVAEDFISTRWFIARYEMLTHKPLSGVKELAERYDTDSFAKQVFEEFGQNISTVMDKFVEKYTPDVIVFGGNIAQASALFFPAMEQRLAKYSPKVSLKKSALHEYAALMGAVGFGVAETK